MERRWTSCLFLLCSALAIATASLYADRAVAQPGKGEVQVVTPGSSVPKPEDAGIHARTNVKLVVPLVGLGSVAPPQALECRRARRAAARPRGLFCEYARFARLCVRAGTEIGR